MKKTRSFSIIPALLLSVCFQSQAQQVNINLKINDGAEAAVFQNEPVLLDVAVFNKKAQADRRWNRAGEERMKELDEMLKTGKIKQEEYDREKNSIEKSRRSTEISKLGSPTSSWTTAISWKVMNTANRNYIELPLKRMKKPASVVEAVLDADGYFTTCYGISPDAMNTVPPGIYAIECFINNIPSNAVLFTVKSGHQSEAISETEPELIRLARFYWHDENGAKTMLYADKALAKNPASLDALSLKADGQILQGQFLPALETYNQAVKEYYRQNGSGSEPPEYLISMIDFVKKQMGN